MNLNFFILIMLPILQINAELEQCYAEETSPYVYFSSRTSYFSGRGSQMRIPENCEPIYLWGLIRHGTRYPKMDTLKSTDKLYALRDEIILNHKNKRGNLCEKDLMNLKNWRTNLPADISKEYNLVPQGVKDQIFLAQRIKEVFPELFKSPTKDNTMFQSSGQSRTRDSAIIFSNELIGSNFTTTEGNNITEDAEFLQLSEHCPRNSKEVENNPSTYIEGNLFKKGAYFQKIIAEISIRLGYLQPLPLDSIILMSDICAYENAWDIGSKPPFCAVFSSDELEAINYMTDVNMYYRQGHGSHFVNHLGCPIVRDMVMSLQSANQDVSKSQKGKFLFSHSETILPVTAALGLRRDEEPLRHDNYQKMIKQRKWRLALFDTFAANIITVLYKCSSENVTQTKAVIYQNERPSVFPQCNNSSLCDLESLQKMYSDVFNENECDTKICQLTPQRASSARSISTNPIIFFAIIFSTFQRYLA